MGMKRTSFVCFGARGAKDALVYQEIPGRDGGEEFFLFFSPGEPAQEDLLRGLFREAVSASRLGAPTHYFSCFLEQYRTLSGTPGSSVDRLAGALLMIMIRRGEDVHLLCNRDAALIHRDAVRETTGFPGSLRDLAEVPLGAEREQRDLFERAPDDIFVLYHFTIADGEHTLVLTPSREFSERYAATFLDSVFFPGFELPRDAGFEIDVPRSLPAIRWRGAEREQAPAPKPRRSSGARRAAVPIAAALCAAGLLAFLIFGPFGKGRESAAEGESSVLLSAEEPGQESAQREAAGERPRDAAPPARTSLSEAWKTTLRAPVTSSPRFYEGLVYFGCRDGNLYAYTPEGELRWKYGSQAGIGASPACSDDRVVCANYRGDVFCLDAEKGTLVWSLPTRAKIVSSPRIWGALVVAATTDGRLVAIRLGDGKKLWEKKLGRSIWATPAVGKDYIVAATAEGALVKLDHRGNVSWKVTPGGEIHSSPACAEERNLVVFGTNDGHVNAHALGNGKRVWRFAARAAVGGSPVVEDDRIYVGAKNGKVFAFALDGTLAWQREIGGEVLSQPLVAGDRIYVTTYASRLVALEAKDGEPAGEYRADSPLYSSPEQGEKRIYFGSNGGVFHALWL